MNKSKLIVGCRGSKLSAIQTESACEKIKKVFSFLELEIITFSSPGDRDKNTPLDISDADFFTRDLDNALINKEIDIAVHSAKDLPEILDDRLDYVWLSWAEDKRDALIARNGVNLSDGELRIGVSSKRREEYAKFRWSDCTTLPIRGNIEERLEQLDRGNFDVVIIALAALTRLNLENRIAEIIPLHKLKTPDGQGHLAVTFRKDNILINKIKQFFLKSVVFAGAGVGSYELATVATIDALKSCDVCIYDALIDQELLKYVPATSEVIFAGKRADNHSMKQIDISHLILKYAREDNKVVRLKGGDPGLFGRLKEEVLLLEEYKIPFRVIPGVNSVTAATTATGLLLTNRDISRGYSVATIQKSKIEGSLPFNTEEIKDLPNVFLMSSNKAKELSENLIGLGKSPTVSTAIVNNAYSNSEEIKFCKLNELGSFKVKEEQDPSIIIVGNQVDKEHLYKKYGAFSGAKVAITCSDNISLRAKQRVLDLGGCPVMMPLIKTVLDKGVKEVFSRIKYFDYIILTSPSSVKHLFEALKAFNIDIRRLPKIVCHWDKTAEALKEFNIVADFICNVNNKGILHPTFIENVDKNSKILRVRSNLAGEHLSSFLRENGYLNIEDDVLYRTKRVEYETCPNFDKIFFASNSGVGSFVANFGFNSLYGKDVAVIGNPTMRTFKNYFPDKEVIMPKIETVESCIDSLAIQAIVTSLDF